MKIRDLDKGRYIIVYDMGKSEYSEGMTVVGEVVELEYNEDGKNTATIESMPFQRYTVTDDNYFDYWNDYMENKTERVGIKRQSNDVQQRKRNVKEIDGFKTRVGEARYNNGHPINDTVNHPNHYNYGDIEVIDFIEQVTKHYNPNVAYHIGNAIKYLARSPHKNGKEDVDKARWYIERAFENWDVK